MIPDEGWCWGKYPTTAKKLAGEGTWLKGKSGTEERATYWVNGSVRKTRNMKWAVSTLRSNKDILDELYVCKPDVFYLNQKSKAGKVRGVVKTGNKVCRKMDFLCEFVFAGAARNEEIDRGLLDLIEHRHYWMVPLDQSGFDQHQSRRTVLMCVAAVLEQRRRLSLR